jgi:hypothetical protein
MWVKNNTFSDACMLGCVATPAAEKRRRRGPSTGAGATAGAGMAAGAGGICSGARTGCGAAGAAGNDTETALAVTDTHCGGGCTGGGVASSSSSGTCRCVATCCQVTCVFRVALRRLPVGVGEKGGAVDASVCLHPPADSSQKGGTPTCSLQSDCDPCSYTCCAPASASAGAWTGWR